ncbi:hypothetical protein [Paenibacillus sp. FSL K6-2524]|uniref:hypothetical protein n=1 Tax=Paenibacillus sp. FSL K6-2524 TaxID=2954516 RepID=UPI0030FBC770
MGNKPVHIIYSLITFVNQLMNRIGNGSHHPTEYFPSVLDNAIVVAQLLLAESIGKPCPIAVIRIRRPFRLICAA